MLNLSLSKLMKRKNERQNFPVEEASKLQIKAWTPWSGWRRGFCPLKGIFKKENPGLRSALGCAETSPKSNYLVINYLTKINLSGAKQALCSFRLLHRRHSHMLHGQSLYSRLLHGQSLYSHLLLVQYWVSGQFRN